MIDLSDYKSYNGLLEDKTKMSVIKNYTVMPFPDGLSIAQFYKQNKNRCIIASVGQASPSLGVGGYRAALYFNGYMRTLTKSGIKTLTPSYPYIQGLIDAARLVKRPCEAVILTATEAGFTDTSHPEHKYCEMAVDALLKAGCSVTVVVCRGKSGELSRFIGV